ncbi:MAG: sugar transferase, partial [Solirubrobacteraceae bacterium]
MTIEHKEAIPSRTNGGHGGAVPRPLPERDVRRKRPPVLMFLLRKETRRRIVRVLSLLIVDFVGVTAAIFTAIAIKLTLRGDFSLDVAWGNTRTPLAFAYLLTVLMFARVDLYADRPRRPGLPKIFSALFQATVIALVFALATGNHFKSYYIFYGALFFGTAYISILRELYTRGTGWALEQAGYRRRALLVGSGKHIE